MYLFLVRKSKEMLGFAELRYQGTTFLMHEKLMPKCGSRHTTIL
jgi:hypothetical protein